MDLPVWPKYDNAKPQLFQFREDQYAIIADDYRQEAMQFSNAKMRIRICRREKRCEEKIQIVM